MSVSSAGGFQAVELVVQDNLATVFFRFQSLIVDVRRDELGHLTSGDHASGLNSEKLLKSIGDAVLTVETVVLRVATFDPFGSSSFRMILRVTLARDLISDRRAVTSWLICSRDIVFVLVISIRITFSFK